MRAVRATIERFDDRGLLSYLLTLYNICGKEVGVTGKFYGFESALATVRLKLGSECTCAKSDDELGVWDFENI